MKSRSSRQAKAREFSRAERNKIYERDGGKCIFCQKEYHMEESTWYGRTMLSVMHFIPRSKNGLGIERNGAIGCAFHHEMLDNGYRGRREEMLSIFRAYLKGKYAGWNEEELVYEKWRRTSEQKTGEKAI